MINGIKTAEAISERLPDRGAPQRDPRGEGEERNRDAPRRPAESASESERDLRLVIEPDAEGRDLVYRLIDRKSGKVIAERPRDQVERLADGENYRAGTVVSTKA